MGCFGGSKSKKKRPSSQTKKFQKPKPKPWSDDEWKIHGRYLAKLSAPKKNYAEEKPFQSLQSRKAPLSSLKSRMDKLSRPKAVSSLKHRCSFAPNECHCHVAEPIRKIPAQAKSYVPSNRIVALSEPKLNYQEVIRCFPKQRIMCLNRRILTPGSSYRIKKLAMPKYQYLCTPEHNPYGVKPEALLATASPRIRELAEPKKSLDVDGKKA